MNLKATAAACLLVAGCAASQPPVPETVYQLDTPAQVASHINHMLDTECAPIFQEPDVREAFWTYLLEDVNPYVEELTPAFFKYHCGLASAYMAGFIHGGRW